VLFGNSAQWVQLRTDERNERSAAAIRKLGATDLGTRQENLVRRDGTIRRSRIFRVNRPGAASAGMVTRLDVAYPSSGMAARRTARGRGVASLLSRACREVSNSAELLVRLELALADQRYTNLGSAAGR
jgi:hypothetical protein